MKKFIYAFSESDRDILLSQGYTLLKADNTKKMYVFKNKEELCFSMNDGTFALSDILTFQPAWLLMRVFVLRRLQMKTEILNLTYASSLTDLCEINSSFDSGILRIAYTGDNRNGSSISKDVFESCIKTIYNCPVVCNYDRETDTLGGHDMELVRKDDGSLILVNLTQPIGVVPQTAKVYWETVEEDDGTVNEYLCAEVLIWKRQELTEKSKKMELQLKAWKLPSRMVKPSMGFTVLRISSLQHLH